MAITRVNPDWAFGGKLSSAELDAIEDNITYALDKRAGQTDTLASDVTVTGETTFDNRVHINATLDVAGDVTMDDTLTVGSVVATTATVSGAVSVGGALSVTGNIVASDDVQVQGAKNVRLATGNVTLSPARTITRVIPLGLALRGEGVSTADLQVTDDTIKPDTTAVTTRKPSSLQFATANQASDFSNFWVLDLTPYVPDGATITEAQFTLRGAGAHAGLPNKKTRVRIGREGGVGAALHSSGTTVVDASASVSIYQGSHGLTVTCNQNNVVDKSQYTYYAHIINEGGTNAVAGLIYTALTLTFTVPSLSAAP